MYPGMIAWWKKAQQHAGCGASAGCGPSGGRWHGASAAGDHDGEFGGWNFGVRRPLRFLAEKLDLNEKQVADLAHLMNDLKTERAQAAVDNRRVTAAFADALAADALDEAKILEAAGQRVKIAERLRDAVTKTLVGTHKLLTPEQRSRLAYLIRTGAITI